MPLTRFPDHEDKRVFLSTVLSFNLPPQGGAHPDRLSVAVLWLDLDSPAASELNLDFATELLQHGALAIVIGGSAAEAAGAVFEKAVAQGDFPGAEDEAIGLWMEPDATVEELLFIAAEDAMPPDAWADHPWDIVAWARSGDPSIALLRPALQRLTQIVDETYELGGDEDT